MDAGELLYLASLAAVLGMAAGVLGAALAGADHALARRHPAWVALAVALLGLPITYQIGQYMKLAESLHGRGIPLELVAWACTGLASALLVVVWAQLRFARTALVSWLVALPLLLVLAELDTHYGFTARRFAALLAICAILSLASAIARTLEQRGSALALASVGALLVLGLALVGRVADPAFASGRRRVLVRRSSLAHLDSQARVFAARYAGYRSPGATAKSCAAPGPVQTAPLQLTPAQRRNVILISIDTLRADDARSRVGGQPLMPALERFRKSAWAASAAYTGYPATTMALSSAFSGLMPSRVVLSAAPPPSVFGAASQRFDDVSVLLPTTRYFRRPALASYIVQGATRVAHGGSTQTRTAIERLTDLREHNQSHLMWVHYFEPHEPYVQHRGFQFGSTDHDRYRSELAAVDRELGELLTAIERMGAYDDSLVIVFADHGESFGEHGHAYHHFDLYPWLLRVPFVLHVPGQAPRTIAGPVHLTDIAATVLDFAGLPAALPLDGRSLLRGDPPASRAILSEEFAMQSALLEQFEDEGLSDENDVRARIDRLELSPGYASKVSVIQDAQQLIVHSATNIHELYRIDRDPRAEHDLADSEPAAEQRLRAELASYYRRASPSLGCMPDPTRSGPLANAK